MRLSQVLHRGDVRLYIQSLLLSHDGVFFSVADDAQD